MLIDSPALRSAILQPPTYPVAGGLLMHMDGPDAATAATDEYGHAVSFTGNAKLSAAVARFGVSSLRLDGTGDYISITSDAAIQVGSDDFTIAFWIMLLANSTEKALIGNRTGAASNTSYLLKIGSTQNCLSFHSDGTALFDNSANPLALNRLQHVETARAGTTQKVFIDGIQIASFSNSFNHSSTNSFIVGHEAWALPGVGDVNAYIDELLIVKGAALHTANFVPPTRPYLRS